MISIQNSLYRNQKKKTLWHYSWKHVIYWISSQRMNKFFVCFPVSFGILLNIPIEYFHWIFILDIFIEYFFWIFFYGIYLIEYQVREWAKSLFIFLSPSAQTTLHLPSLKPTLHDKKKPHWKKKKKFILFALLDSKEPNLSSKIFLCKYSS